MALHLPTTKSQTLSLLLAEISAMRNQCEDYRQAVDHLSSQVNDLAELVILKDQEAKQREEALLAQLNELQEALPDGLDG